jgi:hypothetical protein
MAVVANLLAVAPPAVLSAPAPQHGVLAGLCAVELARVALEAAKNPADARFTHDLFSALAAAILALPAANATEAGSALLADLGPGHLFPLAQVVLSGDIEEFVPYVFQVLAVLLRADRAGHPGTPLAPPFASMLPPSLTAQLWASASAAPALSILVQAFAAAAAQTLLPHIPQLVDVVVTALASQSTSDAAFDALEAVLAVPELVGPLAAHISRLLGTLASSLAVAAQIAAQAAQQPRMGRLGRRPVAVPLTVAKLRRRCLVFVADLIGLLGFAPVVQAMPGGLEALLQILASPAVVAASLRERKAVVLALTRALGDPSSPLFLRASPLHPSTPQLLRSLSAALSNADFASAVAHEAAEDVAERLEREKTAGSFHAVFVPLRAALMPIPDAFSAVPTAQIIDIVRGQLSLHRVTLQALAPEAREVPTLD